MKTRRLSDKWSLPSSNCVDHPVLPGLCYFSIWSTCDVNIYDINIRDTHRQLIAEYFEGMTSELNFLLPMKLKESLYR